MLSPIVNGSHSASIESVSAERFVLLASMALLWLKLESGGSDDDDERYLLRLSRLLRILSEKSFTCVSTNDGDIFVSDIFPLLSISFELIMLVDDGISPSGDVKGWNINLAAAVVVSLFDVAANVPMHERLYACKSFQKENGRNVEREECYREETWYKLCIR